MFLGVGGLSLAPGSRSDPDRCMGCKLKKKFKKVEKLQPMHAWAVKDIKLSLSFT